MKPKGQNWGKKPKGSQRKRIEWKWKNGGKDVQWVAGWSKTSGVTRGLNWGVVKKRPATSPMEDCGNILINSKGWRVREAMKRKGYMANQKYT